MKQLQHTLFVTENNIKLMLRNGAAEAILDNKEHVRFPLHLLDSIVSFSKHPATAELMEECVKRGIPMIVLSRGGRFRFRVEGRTHGNTMLRMQQYAMAGTDHSMYLTKTIITAKIKNEITVMQKYQRNHRKDVDFEKSIRSMRVFLNQIPAASSLSEIRTAEAHAAIHYFQCFSEMIRSHDPEMQFSQRSRRPPVDPCNALLSLSYSILTSLCTSALESVVLDPSLGVMHSVRPGRLH